MEASHLSIIIRGIIPECWSSSFQQTKTEHMHNQNKLKGMWTTKNECIWLHTHENLVLIFVLIHIHTHTYIFISIHPDTDVYYFPTTRIKSFALQPQVFKIQFPITCFKSFTLQPHTVYQVFLPHIPHVTGHIHSDRLQKQITDMWCYHSQHS